MTIRDRSGESKRMRLRAWSQTLADRTPLTRRLNAASKVSLVVSKLRFFTNNESDSVSLSLSSCAPSTASPAGASLDARCLADGAVTAPASSSPKMSLGAHSRKRGTCMNFLYANFLNAAFALLGFENSTSAMVRTAGNTTRSVCPNLENSAVNSSAVACRNNGDSV